MRKIIELPKSHSINLDDSYRVYSLVESCKANKVNPLTYLTYILSNARNKAVVLPTPDDFADRSTAPAGRCAL